jgi:hypothetical protein
MAAWWVLNLLQAAFTGLADDEAYYWYFSQHLDWGYFDHPPMVALLVRLSSWLPGALGIRFLSTLLQPLYLLLFWHIIRPADATRRDALLYVLLCFSQPLLQLYGFLAVPDAPLMFFTVVFLWAYKRFRESSTLPNALIMGTAVALLGYSKYHGALVVLLVLLSDLRLFRRWQLYAAGFTALLLFLPHLWWQYTHDWVSFGYHLSGRNAWAYKPSFTFEYIALLLCIFNPLWLYHYWRGIADSRSNGVPLRNAMLWLAAGFALFFLLSTVRGSVQPQWVLPVALPLTALLFHASRQSRYVRTAAIVIAVLFIAVRVVTVTNPMEIKGELWYQKQTYYQIANLAGDRPVVFMQNYTAPAKYTYYTGRTAYCSPYFYTRHSQWQYDTLDRTFRGRDVIVGNLNNNAQEGSLALADGRTFHYSVVHDYMPLRELRVECLTPLDLAMPYLRRDSLATQADSIAPVVLTMAVHNPYHFDIYSTDSLPLRMQLYFHVTQYYAAGAFGLLTDTLRANAVTVIEQPIVVPLGLDEGVHAAGFAIGPTGYDPADNSPTFTVAVRHGRDTLFITKQ